MTADEAEWFRSRFLALTGNEPLTWQRRLYADHFSKDDLPRLIDLPTGLGKTMVMAVWLLARLQEGSTLPRRLVYVVDRRTVVDQATDLAEEFAYLLHSTDDDWSLKLAKRKPALAERKANHSAALADIQKRLGGDLAVSTLRGQLADNRQWSRDPSRPAIVVGTVDLIGSGLLFSGYRSGYKTKPLHAGLLGQDSLLVLDEAHLSKPFAKLVKSIRDFQSPDDNRMRVCTMSATSGDAQAEPPFELDTDPKSPTYDLWSKIVDGKEANPIKTRFESPKRLTVETADDVIAAIAAAADKVAKSKPGSRIAIFVRSPKDVDAVRKALVRRDKAREGRIAVLTGTMRGLERDALVDPLAKEGRPEQKVMRRFLKPENDPSSGECFLISTSAGEVGFDLNADHLIGDAATLDSWIQRLGRVNRRGTVEGGATVVLVKPQQPADKTDFDRACIAATNLLSDLNNEDVSPKSLAEFKRRLMAEQLAAASTPEPKTLPLTDILVDAWSLTSITGPMPGRPEVAPWLRGVADDLPQTTIAWRAELDLLAGDPDAKRALAAILAKHPVRSHESLTVNSYRVVEFLNQVRKKHPDLLATRVAIKLSRGIEIRTVQQIIEDAGILDADPTLVLPASFGGLNGKGMLSHEDIPATAKLDVADRDGYEQAENSRARLRIRIVRTKDEGWSVEPLLDGGELPEHLRLKSESASESSTPLLAKVRNQGFRIALAHPLKLDADEEAKESLIFLAPTFKRAKPVNQPLNEHVGAVEAEAERIAEALNLNDPVRAAFLFAARWHDEGKKADVWQYFIGRPKEASDFLGKGAAPRDPKSLKGYRHEFGTLLRVRHQDRHQAIGCTPPADPEACDLALHLIATHHGMGRPHFEPAVYAGFTDEERDALHVEAVQRFARLQKRYGHWRLVWLENLLRCADAIASAEVGSTGDEDQTEGKA